MNKLFRFYFILLFPLTLFSQELPIEETAKKLTVQQMIEGNINTSGMFPIFCDSSCNNNPIKKYYYPSKDKTKPLWKRKLFYEDFYLLQTKDLTLRINPLFDFSKGEDYYDTTYAMWYNNLRGIWVGGSLGRNLYFESLAVESQCGLPKFLSNYVGRTVSIPGFARHHFYLPGVYNFSSAQGKLLYHINKNWRVSMGRGKHFIGYGYRSLFLSYNTPPYPFIKATWQSKNKKWQYNSLWLTSVDVQANGSGRQDVFARGYGNFNYLSYAPIKWGRVGIVESKWFLDKVTMFYFSPLLFSSGLTSVNKDWYRINFGLNTSVNLFKTVMLYGQYRFSDTLSYQIGVNISRRINDFFFFVRGEYNKVNTGENAIRQREFYSHLNQFIGYAPENINLEKITSFFIKYKRFFFRFRYNEVERRNNNNSSTVYFDIYRMLEGGIVINPSYQFQFFGRIMYFNGEKWVNFGFRTNIFARYLDL